MLTDRSMVLGGDTATCFHAAAPKPASRSFTLTTYTYVLEDGVGGKELTYRW